MGQDPLGLQVSGCTTRNDCVQIQTEACALDAFGFYSTSLQLTNACAEPIKCVGHVEFAPIPGSGLFQSCAGTPFSLDPGQSTHVQIAAEGSPELCEAVTGAIVANSWKCVLQTDLDTCFAGGADVCKVCP
jgi:hypothetical protein